MHACCFIPHPRKRCTLSQTKSHVFKSCACIIVQYMDHGPLILEKNLHSRIVSSIPWFTELLGFYLHGYASHFPCYGNIQLLWKVKIHSSSKKGLHNFRTMNFQICVQCTLHLYVHVNCYDAFSAPVTCVNCIIALTWRNAIKLVNCSKLNLTEKVLNLQRFVFPLSASAVEIRLYGGVLRQGAEAKAFF